MDTVNRNHAKKRLLIGALLLFGGIVLSGCANGARQGQVLTERTETAAENEKPEKKETDRSLSLREQTEAPERYQKSFQAEAKDQTPIQFEMDAPVLVPDAVKAPVLDMENQPYTQEEYENYLKTIQEELGISLPENETITQNGMDVTFADHYQLSCHMGKNGDLMPKFWLTKIFHSPRQNLRRITVDSEWQETDLWPTDGQTSFSRAAASQAERFISRLGEETFQLSQVSWWEEESQSQSPESGQMEGMIVVLTYVCQYNEIPVRYQTHVLMGTPSRVPQYIQFRYAQDGTLYEMKDIGRMNVREEIAEDDFLLPFQTISEIFEQHCRTWFLTHQWENGQGEWPGQADESVISCDQVSLEYRFCQERTENNGPSKEQLVPVWNFYADAEHGELLVSIDARDGKIYAD